MLNQFNKNMESIRTSKNNPCKFGSLLTYLFFYVQKFFPSKGTVAWRKDVPILYQINEYIAKMGEKYVSIMENYFDAFKDKIIIDSRYPRNLLMITKMMFIPWLTMKKYIFKQSNQELYGSSLLVMRLT